ncbi:MAG: Unknown protein [uncultured Sulfurovum sp.]|uniref:Uncharacterized protein n=1 Tax=uncultured Sulfurovum sp. TaxID=269237 RepID=A0A6S6ST39_9BACT|nr:MAG: Unknown protein [uncultured Sulfurovum sp.]
MSNIYTLKKIIFRLVIIYHSYSIALKTLVSIEVTDKKGSKA